MARDYKKEYREYQGTPEQIKRRAGRNAARAKMEKAGKVKPGHDIDHKNRNPMDNRMSNLRSQSKHKNRGRNK